MSYIHLLIPSATKVLDLGCGTGWVLAESEVAGSSTRIGVDTSLQAVSIGAASYSRMSFCVANGLALPFHANTFDVVVAHVSMPYMKTDLALREIARVLVPGGTVFLTFHSVNYLTSRLLRSIRNSNWRDCVFMVYTASNAILNHFSAPQFCPAWRPGGFETVNTRRGAYGSARKAGFVFISIEHCERIFFAMTATKPAALFQPITPTPVWSVDHPLRSASGDLE